MRPPTQNLSPPFPMISILTTQSLPIRAKKKPSHASKPAKNQWQDKRKQQRQPKSREPTPLKEGQVRLNFTDDTQENWERKIKFALHHKSRVKATCELCEDARPKLLTTADEAQLMATIAAISNLSPDIPEPKARLAATASSLGLASSTPWISPEPKLSI